MRRFVDLVVYGAITSTQPNDLTAAQWAPGESAITAWGPGILRPAGHQAKHAPREIVNAIHYQTARVEPDGLSSIDVPVAVALARLLSSQWVPRSMQEMTAGRPDAEVVGAAVRVMFLP